MKKLIKYILYNLTKRIRKRTEFWIIWLILGLLIDEYIKEGYLFKAEDIYNTNITHEKIIVFLVILLVMLILKKKRSS